MTTWSSFNLINLLCLKIYSFLKGSSVILNNCIIEKNAHFILQKRSKLTIENNSIIKKNSEIRVYESSVLKIFNNCKIDNGVRIISANKQSVIIEENVKIGYYSVLNGGGGILIKKNSSLYGYVYIKSSKHILKDKSFEKEKYNHKRIIINEGSLIEPFTII